MPRKIPCFLVGALILFVFLLPSEASWWNDEWSKKRPINVSVANGTTPSGYQIALNISYDPDMRTNFDDLRFINGSENAELPYWVETKIDGQWAYIWVRIDQNISNITNYTFYMYYGNPTATTKSNATATFLREIDGLRPLKGSWHFDEGNGTIAYDSSGNANHGTLHPSVSPPTWVDGRFKKALSFDGIDDYVRVPDSDSLDTPSITVLSWVRPTSWQADWNVIATKWFDPTSLDRHFAIRRDGAGNRRLNLFLSGLSNFFGNTVLTPEKFYFVGFTFHSETKIATLYLDGNPDGSTTGTKVNSSLSSVQIGDPRSNHGLIGIIDEVYIFNRSLTASEISDLYNNYGYTTLNYPGRVLVRRFHTPEPVSSVGAEITNCNCTSCSDCNTKLNFPECSVVILTTNIINHPGTCIDNPVNFNNKIFNCQGYTIDGNRSGHGIYFVNKHNNTIRNCTITEFYHGVYLVNSSNITIMNCTICKNAGWDIDSTLINFGTNNTCGKVRNFRDYNYYLCTKMCPGEDPNYWWFLMILPAIWYFYYFRKRKRP